MRNLMFLLVLALIAFAGCSGGNNNPVVQTGSFDELPLLNAELFVDGGFQATGIFGAYELIIDPETSSAELLAKRTSTIGEDYIVSGIAFFTITPCKSCLKLIGITANPDGTALLTFSISHPFAPGDPSAPPTAANRNDLDVFDLAALVVPVGATATTYALTGTGIFPETCINQSGYTTELSSLLTTTAAVPYFLVIDDSLGTASTWNKFAMGTSDANFDVGFDLTAGPLVFDMYLTMGYGASAKKLQRLTPKYYNPEFNRKAAWKVVVTPPEGTDPPAIGNTWQDNDTTTLFPVTVEVYDWQAGVAASTTVPYDDEANTGLVYAVSDVASVSVEIPGMNTTLSSATTPASGTGAFDSPLVFEVGVANENALPMGEYVGLVKVTDERATGAIGDRDFLIDTPDGILLNNYLMTEYATYQTFVATVVQGCGPLTLVSLTGCPTADIDNGSTVNFVVAGDSPLGGTPITYEIDTDYDGVTFSADPLYPANQTGIFNVLFNDSPCVVGTAYDIAFRLTDSCGPPANVLIVDQCTVTIGQCCPAVTLTSVVPSTVSVFNSYTIDVYGTGFTTGPDLEALWHCEYYGCPSDYISPTVVVISDTHLTSYFGTYSQRNCYYYNVWYSLTVTNGCGNVSTKLTNCVWVGL